MADVARAAGVSKATVSRVLAGMQNGSTPATAERVRNAAERLGYVVNAIASSLRSRQTFTIGLIVADVANPFFGGIASGVETRLQETGYSVILGNSGNALARERDIVRVLVEKQIDGLIAATSATVPDHLLEAQRRGVRLILVDSEIDGIDCDTITIDNRTTACQAVDHLLDLGHKRVAVITGPLEAAFDRQRLDGYRQALERRGLPVDERLILRADLLAEGGEQAIARLLALKKRPTGLFVTNNMMTLGALVGLTRAGIRLPQDISMVGFDDQDWYSVCHPPLTSMRNPAYDMGYAAADRLLEQLAEKAEDRARRIILPSELIVRDSTARPKR